MRVWVYEQLMSLDPPVGVYENTSLDTVPDEQPFIVYSMGTTTPELVDGERTIAESSSLTIYVHGVPGDYQPIDELLLKIKAKFEVLHSGIIAARFRFSSDDLRDPEMGTIMRYSRYQLVHVSEEVQ